jgi:hypothetical protein
VAGVPGRVVNLGEARRGPLPALVSSMLMLMRPAVSTAATVRLPKLPTMVARSMSPLTSRGAVRGGTVRETAPASESSRRAGKAPPWRTLRVVLWAPGMSTRTGAGPMASRSLGVAVPICWGGVQGRSWPRQRLVIEAAVAGVGLFGVGGGVEFGDEGVAEGDGATEGGPFDLGVAEGVGEVEGDDGVADDRVGVDLDVAGGDLGGGEADVVGGAQALGGAAAGLGEGDGGDGWREGHVQKDMSFEGHEDRLLGGPAALGVGGEEAQLGVGVAGGEEAEEAAGADAGGEQDLSVGDGVGLEGGGPGGERLGVGGLDLHLELDRVERGVGGEGEELKGVAADRQGAVEGEGEGRGLEGADGGGGLHGAERVAVEEDLGEAGDDVLDDEDLGVGLVGVDAEAADGGVQEVG